MSVDDVYKLVQYIANKSQAGYISPAQFNLVINQGSNSYLDFLLGEIKDHKVNVELWTNRKMRNILAPLIDPPATLTVDGTGLSPKPTGYLLIDAMYTTSMDRVRFVQQNALYSYLKSQIDPIATNPIYLIEGDGFKFYPITIGNALISFVKNPAVIKWNFTVDPNGRPVYTATGSTDPFWDNTSILEVIGRTLRMVGVNLQSTVVQQYSSEIKSVGQ